MSGENLRGVFQYPQLHDGTLKEMLDAGYTYEEVAAEVGCCRAAVYHAVVRYGLRHWQRPDIAHPLMSDRAAVEEFLRAERPSLAQLCKKFMTSGVTVRMWLRTFGLYDEWLKLGLERQADARAAKIVEREARQPYQGKYPKLRDTEWLKAEVEARGAMAVSKELDCHVSSVMRALEREGIEYARRPDLKRGPGQDPLPSRERAVTLMEAGYSATEAAAIVGTNPQNTARWAKAAGIPLTRGRPKKQRPLPKRMPVWV